MPFFSPLKQLISTFFPGVTLNCPKAAGRIPVSFLDPDRLYLLPIELSLYLLIMSSNCSTFFVSCSFSVLRLMSSEVLMGDFEVREALAKVLELCKRRPVLLLGLLEII